MPATAVITARPPVTYDAEYHLGLIAEDSSGDTRAYNTATLNTALEGMHRNGNVTLAHGGVGPLMRPISFTAKNFHFNAPIITPTRLGGGLIGSPSWGPIGTNSQFQSGSSVGGLRTRLTFTGNNSQGYAAIRVRGGGFVIENLDIMASAAGDNDIPTSCIEIEARANPETNYNIIRNCSLTGSVAGIEASYTFLNDSNELEVAEGGGAHGVVDNVSFTNLDYFFVSGNANARHWHFNNIVGSETTAKETTVFKLTRGGAITANGVKLGISKATLFDVENYSRSSQRLVCDNLYWDERTTGSHYLSLFKYSGSTGDASSKHWMARVTGMIDNTPSSPTYDTSKFIQVSALALNFPLDDLLFDISNLPLDHFRLVGNGPWVRPE